MIRPWNQYRSEVENSNSSDLSGNAFSVAWLNHRALPGIDVPPSSGSGMIYLSFHTFSIDKLIFILVYQTNGRLQIKLKLTAIFA